MKGYYAHNIKLHVVPRSKAKRVELTFSLREKEARQLFRRLERSFAKKK
jgi:hypothetical protein